MTWIVTLLPYVVSTMVGLWLAAYAYRRRSVPGALPFAVFLLGEALWTAGYIFELVSKSLAAKVDWDSFQFIGVFTVGLAIVVMARSYVGKPAALSKWSWLVLLLVPVGVTLAALSDPWHHLLRQSAHVVPGDPVGALLYDFTAVDFVGIAFVYGNCIYALALFMGYWRRARGP